MYTIFNQQLKTTKRSSTVLYLLNFSVYQVISKYAIQKQVLQSNLSLKLNSTPSSR